MYLTLGQDSNGNHDLVINNQMGKIYSFSHDNTKLEFLADNLAAFLIAPIKGYSELNE